MTDERQVEPGKWGACKCKRMQWRAPGGEWISQATLRLRPRTYCWYCGDLCLPGGEVTNLRRVAEAMLAEVEAQQASGIAVGSGPTYLVGRISAFRELLGKEASDGLQ